VGATRAETAPIRRLRWKEALEAWPRIELGPPSAKACTHVMRSEVHATRMARSIRRGTVTWQLSTVWAQRFQAEL
jgi:hypothetical protein